MSSPKPERDTLISRLRVRKPHCYLRNLGSITDIISTISIYVCLYPRLGKLIREMKLTAILNLLSHIRINQFHTGGTFSVKYQCLCIFNVKNISIFSIRCLTNQLTVFFCYTTDVHIT